MPASLVMPSWTIAVPAVTVARAESPRAAVTSGPVDTTSGETPAPPRQARPIAALVWAAGFAAGLAVLLAA